MAKFYVQAGWRDAPHVTDEQIERELQKCESHLREARSEGTPAMGSGMVYPIKEDEIKCGDSFRLKGWYRRCYGLDVGWNCTAAVWFAYDPDNDVIYLYDCYKAGQKDPETHASAIGRRDSKKPPLKIPGAIDPAAVGSGQHDGKQLIKLYRDAGLNVIEADNSRETAFQSILGYMQAQKFKVVDNPNTEAWFREFRTFIRNDRGKIVNEGDYHLMAATRYAFMTGLKIAKPLPPAHDIAEHIQGSRDYGLG